MSDQRRLPHEHRPHQVYVLRNSAEEVIYIGCTSKLAARLGSHRRTQPWWPEVDPTKTVVTDETTWEEARELEEAAIQQWQPRHNKHLRNGSVYVAMGVRDLITTETRLKRAAATGDPDALAALVQWQDEQLRMARERMEQLDFSGLFSAARQVRAS